MLFYKHFACTPLQTLLITLQSSNSPLNVTSLFTSIHWCAIEPINTTTYEKTSMCDCLNNRRKFEKNDDDKKLESGENKWQWKKKNLNKKNHQTYSENINKVKKDNNHIDEMRVMNRDFTNDVVCSIYCRAAHRSEVEATFKKLK
jgi:hypothetical protein